MVISLKSVSKQYGASIALAPLTLDFAKEKTTVLIGSSGCGKSTILRLIVRAIIPTTGRVFFNHELLTAETANSIRQRIGYMTQGGGLFPHLTIEANISLVARFLKLSKTKIASRLFELSELVQLPPRLLNLYPNDLSGGQQQRVSLMRALMLNPPCLLLDEPLGALDPIIRRDLQIQLQKIFSTLNKTVIFVTHDIHEAGYLGDEIILMRAGKVVQKGSFQDLNQSPKEAFVSQFIQQQEALLKL